MPSLPTARFASVAAIILALFVTGAVAGAAGSAMIIGSEANNAGSANTQLQTNSSVVAFKLLQNGPGTALMGYTTPTSGATRGVYGRVDSANGDGVQARNGAASIGTGAALHAYGQANIGIIAESTGAVPLKLIAPGGTAPFSTNSSTKVTNLNADKLDGLSSGQFARSDVPVTGHFNCMSFSMQPRESGYTYAISTGKYLTSGANGTFTCDVNLPDGATIIALRGSVQDNTASFEAGCSLVRVNLSTGGVAVLAETNLSGVAETPGNTILEDTVIGTPLIENSLYAYTAQCALTGASTSLQLFAVSIEYQVSGLPVP